MRGVVLHALLLGASLATPAQAAHHGWKQAGGLGRDVLVGAALLAPAVQRDWTGDVQAGESLLLAEGVSYGLKQAIHEETTTASRPVIPPSPSPRQ